MAARRPLSTSSLSSRSRLVFTGAIIVSAFASLVLHSLLPQPYSYEVHFPDDTSQEYEDHYCPAYGCPIYPLEKDSEVVKQTLDKLATSAWPTQKHPPPFARPSGSTVTFQSNQHTFNQDRALIIRPFHTHQTAASTSYNNANESFLIAILDGHGVEGHIVADYVAKELPRLLASKLSDRPGGQPDEWIQQQLNATFVQVNEEAPPNALRGGCTASVTLRIGPKVFFANAGDSRTILVASYASAETEINDKNTQIIYQTRLDKPHLPDEKARIEGLGGKIHIPPQHPMGSRVVVYSTAAIPPEPIGLAMSRSLGDWEWKEVGVTAEPIVHVVDLSSLPQQKEQQQQLFVVAASDGLWDLRPRPEFFAKQFASAFVPQPKGQRNNLLQKCVDIIDQLIPSNPAWYRDDISVIVAPIQGRMTTM